MRISRKGMFMEYDDFYEIEEIGSGGYGTVYTAKRKKYPRVVVLKKFKNFDKNLELFINEVSIHIHVILININYCIDYAHTRKPCVYESDFNLIIIHCSHLIVQKLCYHVYTWWCISI